MASKPEWSLVSEMQDANIQWCGDYPRTADYVASRTKTPTVPNPVKVVAPKHSPTSPGTLSYRSRIDINSSLEFNRTESSVFSLLLECSF